MSVEHDFHLHIEDAAGLITDAASSLRIASRLRLPRPHQQLLGNAVRGLDDAQDALFKARNDPWSTPKPRRHQQLELL